MNCPEKIVKPQDIQTIQRHVEMAEYGMGNLLGRYLHPDSKLNNHRGSHTVEFFPAVYDVNKYLDLCSFIDKTQVPIILPSQFQAHQELYQATKSHILTQLKESDRFSDYQKAVARHEETHLMQEVKRPIRSIMTLINNVGYPHFNALHRELETLQFQVRLLDAWLELQAHIEGTQVEPDLVGTDLLLMGSYRVLKLLTQDDNGEPAFLNNFREALLIGEGTDLSNQAISYYLAYLQLFTADFEIQSELLSSGDSLALQSKIADSFLYFLQNPVELSQTLTQPHLLRQLDQAIGDQIELVLAGYDKLRTHEHELYGWPDEEYQAEND